MGRTGIYIAVLSIVLAGCTQPSDALDKSDKIIKIVDFELSPDENKIAFSAITPIGNTDIWVVDIDGTNLKKLTFKDRSPSNHIARFFKRRKWRNFFRIDIHSPLWTKDGRIAFVQELTRYSMWGVRTMNVRQWTVKPDGTDKRSKRSEDEVVRRRPFSPIHSFEMSDESKKYKKEIFLKDDTVWVLNFGETSPKKLIQ